MQDFGLLHRKKAPTAMLEPSRYTTIIMSQAQVPLCLDHTCHPFNTETSRISLSPASPVHFHTMPANHALHYPPHYQARPLPPHGPLPTNPSYPPSSSCITSKADPPLRSIPEVPQAEQTLPSLSSAPSKEVCGCAISYSCVCVWAARGPRFWRGRRKWVALVERRVGLTSVMSVCGVYRGVYRIVYYQLASGTAGRRGG